MASRADIEAGKAHILVYLKNQVAGGLNALKGQLQGIGRSVMGWGGMITGLGAAIATPLLAAVAHFSAVGSELADLSARTGQSVQSLAELKFAAEQTGSSLADVEKAIINQQKKGLGSDFDKVAAGIAAIEDPAKRTQAAFEAWGKSGVKLLPMVSDLASLRQEARDLGLVPTEDAVAGADAIGDAFDKVKSVLSATVFEVGAALAPVLMPALETAKRIAGWINKWVRENGAIIRTVAMIAAGLIAAGAVVTAIGAGIFVVGSVLGAAASIVSVLGTVIGALFSPIGLVTAAIIGGVTAWAMFTESGKQTVSAIVGFFMPMVETIKTAIGGIGDALMAGDLVLAGQIAVKALQLVFQQGLAAIANMIGGQLGDVIGTIGTQLIAGDFAGAWDTAVAGMGAVWDSFLAGILETMSAVVGKIQELWNSAVAGIRVSLGVLQMAAGALPEGRAKSMAQAFLGVADAGVQQVGSAGDSALTIGKSVADFLATGQRHIAERSSTEFNKRIAGGADAASDAAAALAAELDELRKQAAEARASAAAAPAPATPEGVTADQAKRSVAGTFSAAGFLAMAQGGARDPVVRTLQEQKQILREMYQEQKEARRAAYEMNRLMRT